MTALPRFSVSNFVIGVLPLTTLFSAMAATAAGTKVEPAVAHFDRGMAEKDANNYKGAIKDFTKAIQLKADFAEAYFNRGLVKTYEFRTVIVFVGNRGSHREGGFESAIADFTKAIELKPDYVEAYRGPWYDEARQRRQ